MYIFDKRLLLAAFVASVLSVIMPQMSMAEDVTTSHELQTELQKIENRYDDVRNELNEEYAALVKEHDEKSNSIFAEVKALKQEQASNQQKLEADYNDFQNKMTSANISSFDEKYKTEAIKLADRGQTNANIFDASMANLRHMYLLNTQRFEELMKIHNAREALEERKYRQERDFVRDQVRLQDRIRAIGTDAKMKDSVKFSEQAMQERKNMIDQSYQNTLAALDEYKDLVEKRMNDQENYLSQVDGIKRNMARADATPEEMAQYRDQLVSLEDQKNMEEAAYNNNVEFIEEKLSLAQMRDRELANLDNAKLEMERKHAASYERIAAQRENLNHRLADSSLTIADRASLEKQLGNFDAMYEREDKTYNDAVAAYEDRRDIIEQAYKERLAYIEDRNDIRVRMAETPITNDNIGQFRDDISKLEERRINEEKAIRDKLMTASDKVPNIYRVSVYTVNMDNDGRQKRSASRMGGMKSRLESRWNREQKELQDRKTTLQERMNATDMSAQEKQNLQSLIDSIDSQLASKKQRYDDAVQKLDERVAAEKEMMAGRAAYMKQREQLMQNLGAKNATYDDIIKYETELNALDSDWDKRMNEYRTKMRSFRGIMPTDDSRQWRARAQQDWQRGVSNAENAARQSNQANDPSFTRRVSDNVDSLGDRIVQEYHEVVDYFKN